MSTTPEGRKPGTTGPQLPRLGGGSALEAQVDQDRKETIDVAMIWLTGRTSPQPWRFATQLMVAGVFRQAGLLGLVDCSRCGDQGCDWCEAQR